MPRSTAHLRAALDTEVLERAAVQPGQHEQVVERRGLAGVEVEHRPRGLVGVLGGRGPRMELDDTGVGQPGQRGRFLDQRVPLGLAGIGGLVPPAPPPVRRVRQHGLLPEPLAGHAVRMAAEVHRPVGQVREDGRCSGDDVADEVPLGHRGPTTRLCVARREQHLVQVGQAQGAALEDPLAAPRQLVQLGQLGVRDRDHVGQRRPSGGDLGLVGGRVTAPQGLGRSSHVLVGAPALDRAADAPPGPSRRRRGRPACGGAATRPSLHRSGAGPCRRCGRGRTGRPASRRRGRSGARRPPPRPADPPRPGSAPIGPRSQTMTSPPPYSPAGMTPSKSA